MNGTSLKNRRLSKRSDAIMPSVVRTAMTERVMSSPLMKRST